MCAFFGKSKHLKHLLLNVILMDTDGTTIFECSCEYGESAALYNFGYVTEFHAKTCIRLIGTETVHCFLPWHSRQRQCHIHTDCFLENIFEQSLVDI